MYTNIELWEKLDEDLEHFERFEFREHSSSLLFIIARIISMIRNGSET